MIGMSFRFFDAESRQWSIYWADSRRCGVLDPPVFGSFEDGIGIFEGEDTFEGRPILVRFTWSRVATPTPRWEQAFSADGGETLGAQLDDGLRARGGRPMSALATVGEVAPDYRHVEKVIHPRPVVETGGGLLKWYDIAEGDRPVPRDVRRLAGEALDAIAADSALGRASSAS